MINQYFNPENPSQIWANDGVRMDPMPDWVQACLAGGKNLTDCILQDKKPLRNSAVTFKQVDWTDEQPVNDLTDRCLSCASPLLNLRGDLFGAGRPSVYCSNACKMKAYRKRSKSLRNVQHQTEQKPLSVSKRSNVVEL
jgi:ferredoxin